MSRSSDRPLRSLAQRLDDEWLFLRYDRQALRRAAGWHVIDTDLHCLDQVLVSIGFGSLRAVHPPIDREGAECRMRRLVELGRDDPLAVRVVLQRLLPGLLAIARRRATATTRAPAQIDELVAAAWIVIATFNPARRPGNLAAAMVADADEQAFRRAWRRASAREVVTTLGFDGVVDTTPVHPADEVRSLLRLAAEAGMPASELDLIRRLLADETTDDLARELALTSRAVRYRRARITDQLRDLARAA
jgi:hypothetical protein